MALDRTFEKYKNPEPYPQGPARAEARHVWRGENRRLERTVFKADALEKVGLTGHPKADKAFDMAWDRGHSAGLGEVMIELEELAELLLD